MWMVRSSTLRKSEVGSFLRLCRELTLTETPSPFSLFVFLFSSFSYKQQQTSWGLNTERLGSTRINPGPELTNKLLCFPIVASIFCLILYQIVKILNAGLTTFKLGYNSVKSLLKRMNCLNYFKHRKHQLLIKCYKQKSSSVTFILSSNINNPLIS